MTQPDTSYSTLVKHVPSRDRITSPRSQAAKRILLDQLETIKLPAGVKAIPLTKGKYTIVDAEDYHHLMQWEWQYRDGYAKRGVRGLGAISMHGVILTASNGLLPDHKNGDGLDNRRENLRPATQQQNMWNRKAVTGSKSKYKGVDWYAASGSWRAYIKVNGKQKHLGCYQNEDDAARAYNKAAIEYHGEFARLNPIDGDPAPRLIHPYQHKWHQRKQVDND